MEYVQSAALIAGGIVIVAYFVVLRIDALLPVQGLLGLLLLATGLSWIIRGPLRVFHGPALLVIAMVGASWGALAAGGCLVAPSKVPKAVQVLVGTFAVGAGVIVLLLQLRVIQPT